MDEEREPVGPDPLREQGGLAGDAPRSGLGSLVGGGSQRGLPGLGKGPH